MVEPLDPTKYDIVTARDIFTIVADATTSGGSVTTIATTTVNGPTVDPGFVCVKNILTEDLCLGQSNTQPNFCTVCDDDNCWYKLCCKFCEARSQTPFSK